MVMHFLIWIWKDINRRSFLEEAENMTLFDLLTLKFDLEGQMPWRNTGLSETLDHADTF